jgi:hypothetical protein
LGLASDSVPEVVATVEEAFVSAEVGVGAGVELALEVAELSFGVAY